MSEKGIRASLTAAPKKVDQEAPKKAGQDDDVDLEGYEYRVILHGGIVLQVISQDDAKTLSVNWQQARKADAVLAWSSDQFTEARQIAHIESVVEEDESEEPEEPEEPEAAMEPAAPAAAGSPA